MNEEADTLHMMQILEKTEEYGECILWTGTLSDTGHPIYKPYGEPCTLVRRAVFRLNGGKLVKRQPIDTTCGEKCCVNPEHLFQSTISKVAKRAAAKGKFSGVVRASKIAETRRGKMKLTMDIAREIRNSAESGPVLALRYGVNRSLITRIKSGLSWKEYGGHWAGLLRMAA